MRVLPEAACHVGDADLLEQFGGPALRLRPPIPRWTLRLSVI